MGFTQTKAPGDEMGEIKRMFTPEFRNRLDAVVSFAALDEQIILRVVDKFLMQLEAQLAEKKVEALFTENLKKYLAKNGFDPMMGARPMARLIQDTIRRALADELLFGKLANGGKVTIDLDDKGQVVLDIAQSAPQPPEPVEHVIRDHEATPASRSGRFLWGYPAATREAPWTSISQWLRRHATFAPRRRAQPAPPPRRSRRRTSRRRAWRDGRELRHATVREGSFCTRVVAAAPRGTQRRVDHRGD